MLLDERVYKSKREHKSKIRSHNIVTMILIQMILLMNNNPCDKLPPTVNKNTVFELLLVPLVLAIHMHNIVAG